MAADFVKTSLKRNRVSRTTAQSNIFPHRKSATPLHHSPRRSRRKPDAHQVSTPLPQASHLEVFDIDSIYRIDEEVQPSNAKYRPLMERMGKKQYGSHQISLLKGPHRRKKIRDGGKKRRNWQFPELTLQTRNMRVVTRGLITGHPWSDETMLRSTEYWWPEWSVDHGVRPGMRYVSTKKIITIALALRCTKIPH